MAFLTGRWPAIKPRQGGQPSNPYRPMLLLPMWPNSGVPGRQFPADQFQTGPKANDINLSLESAEHYSRFTPSLLGTRKVVIFQERSEDDIFISVQKRNI